MAKIDDPNTDLGESWPSSDEARNFSEKALQDFLCNNPRALGIYNATVIKSEYPTDVGRIDILVKSDEQTLWVVELKAGIANRDAIGQITSYIGAIRRKNPEKTVFGLLVAADFDKACRSAHQAIGDVVLKKYSTQYILENAAPMSSNNGQTSREKFALVVDTKKGAKIVLCPNCGTERQVSQSAQGINCAACKIFVKIAL